MTGDDQDRLLIQQMDPEDLLPLRQHIEQELDWCARLYNSGMWAGWRLCLAFINARLNSQPPERSSP